MKAPYLSAFVSATALGLALVLNFQAGFTLFVTVGVAAIAVADYSRAYKPLVVADGVRIHPAFAAAQPPHGLRLAA